MSPLGWVLLAASWCVVAVLVALLFGRVVYLRDRQKPTGRVDVYVRTLDVAPLHITTKQLGDGVHVDYDHNGDIFGVEVLDARAVDVNGQRVAAPNPVEENPK